MGDVLKFEKPMAEIRCVKTDLWAVWRTGEDFAILLPCKGEVVAFVLSRADTQKLGLELLNTAGSLEEAKKEALAANAELERLRKIKAAARRFIAASSDDCGSYSEEQQAWDALDEALTEASDGRPVTKTALIALAGNSVCPPVARALVEANLGGKATMRGAA